MIVVDSSGVADYVLANEPRASWLAERLEEDPSLHAPYLIDVEVLATIRGAVVRRLVAATRGALALEDFLRFPIRRYPHDLLMDRAWELRDNLTAPDALFVALAEALDAPLVTTDLRLARAPGVRAEVIAFPE